MIRWNNSEGGSFSVDGTSKYGEYDVAQENQELGITIQIAEGYELESISGGKAQVLQRPDGTWSVIVPRGGGVNLSAVLRRIIKEEMKNSRVSNPGASGSEEQTTVQKKLRLCRVPESGAQPDQKCSTRSSSGSGTERTG